MFKTALGWLGGAGGKIAGWFGAIPSTWLLYAAVIGLLFWTGYAVGARHVENRVRTEAAEAYTKAIHDMTQAHNAQLDAQAALMRENQAAAIADAERRARREAEAAAATEILAARAAAGIVDNRQCDIPASVMDAINEAGGLPQ